MSGEQPTKSEFSVDDDHTKPCLRTGNHDKRPKSLLSTVDNQDQTWNKPITCLITAPGPPSRICTPRSTNNQQQLDLEQQPSSSDHQLNPTVFYTTNVQYANITPNRACSMLVDWDKKDEQPQQSSSSQMLTIRYPPPELSVSPADTLSKPSSSDNLSAFSPITSLNNQPLNDSFTNFQHRHSRKHKKFKQVSPLNSPIWPSSKFDTCNRPSSQPHSPSSLSVNYLPSPARDRSYSAGCTSSNFVFPVTTTAATNTISANVVYSSNHSLIDKQNSIGSASSINDFTVEIEALEKAIKSNDWRLVKKLLNRHCSNLNRVYSSSSMNLNLIANQSGATNKPVSSMRASLFEKLSGTNATDQTQLNTQLPSNQSFAQYRAYSAFDSSAHVIEKNIRKESADSQLSNNLADQHELIESPLFNNVLHLAIEHSSIDVVCLLLRNYGFSANTNNQTPFKCLDVWRRRSDSSKSYDSHHFAIQSNEMLDTNGKYFNIMILL